MIKWSVQQNQFQLVPKLKTWELLKLLLVDIKANGSILERSKIADMAQNKQNYLIFIAVLELEQKIKLAELVSC